jgi:hypothetical protein
MITKKALKAYLKAEFEYKHERKRSLEAWLVRYLCQESGYEPENHLIDIVTHGCVSGCVCPLIYNSDIKRFYEKYEAQIWSLVYEFMQNTGESLGQFIDSFSHKITDELSLKVWFSWFAVEHLADRFLYQFQTKY